MKNFLSRDEIDESRFEVGQCSKHGFFIAAQRTPVGWSYVSGCPGCESETKARRIFGQSMIPLRFRDKTFDNYLIENSGQYAAVKSCKAFVTSVCDNPLGGNNLVLVGKQGTGKTHLACSSMNAVVRKSYLTVRYSSVEKILTKLKSTWTDNTASEYEVIERFARVDLLTIDEIGTYRSISVRDKDKMFELINERYERKKPTIFVSNLDLTGENSMESYLEERSFDRICEDVQVVFFEWESYRRKP